MTSTNTSSNPFAFLYKKHSNKHVFSNFERPPFPIIKETPTLGDVLRNLRFGDFVVAGTFYGVGIIGGYYVSRNLLLLSQRLLAYHTVSHIATVTGCMLVFGQSY